MIDELTGVLEIRGGGEPVFVVGWKLVESLQFAEELPDVLVNRLSLFGINTIATCCVENTLPAKLLELAVDGSAAVVLGEHLG